MEYNSFYFYQLKDILLFVAKHKYENPKQRNQILNRMQISSYLKNYEIDQSLSSPINSIIEKLFNEESHEEFLKGTIEELGKIRTLLKSKKKNSDFNFVNQETEDAIWALRCFYQSNPYYIFKLFENPYIEEKKIEQFVQLASKYSKMNFKDMNMLEISEELQNDSNFYPFYVLFYDKTPGSKEGPWITQIILSRTDCNLFVRISYDDVKIGMYRRYPFKYVGDKLQYIRDRHNELYKYADGFLIPGSGNSNHWQGGIKNEEISKRAHFKIKPISEPICDYKIQHINQFAIFDSKEAQKIKNRYRETHELWNSPSNTPFSKQ